ncbi:MAG: YfcC family protein [Candidatus Cyclobacteriaceae bacterium M3_2C_046]
MEKEEKKKKFSFKVPHTLVLLFAMMVLALIATYILPQGSYQTRTNQQGREMVVPGSYSTSEDPAYLDPWYVFLSVPKAFAEAQDIIFFVFIIGGALAVIRATGTIDAVLGKVLEKFGSKPWLLILAGMLTFSIGSSTLGMAEEYLPFVPILIALCIALQLDVITAVGIMVIGYGVGYGVAAINPFTVVIAQGIADLQPTSGFLYRIILLIPFFLIGFHHVYSYAMKVKSSPENSLVAHQNQFAHLENKVYPALTKRHWFILLFTFLAVVLIVYGISEFSQWHWYLEELGAVFLALAIIAAMIGKLSFNKTALEFSNGAAELTVTALLIGFARAIALILEEGQVLHTIVHGLATPLQETGPEIASVGMFLIQSVINFFIPSGSGQAYVTMPLMTPIADLTGVSRQIAVLAYQFGDGFTNMLVPTNAVLMGILGIAGIPYDKWFKFIIPFMIKMWIAGSLALILAVWIGYS